ncbi:single-stranded DNA-binding protein, partial [Metamycoplasma alkalescens]
MNKAFLIGKLVNDPYKGTSSYGQEYSKFTVLTSYDLETKPQYLPCSSW